MLQKLRAYTTDENPPVANVVEEERGEKVGRENPRLKRSN